MRKVTKKELKNELMTIAIACAFGMAIFASILFFGMRARAADVEPFDDLRTIARVEIADLHSAEDWEAPAPSYSQSDLDLLAALIYAEAGDQDFTGMRLVGDCVINRVNSPDPYFPDTVSEVIYQSGQFSPVTDGGLDRAWSRVTSECYEAAALALSGQHVDTNVLYFSMWYCANGEFAYQRGDHYFGY